MLAGEDEYLLPRDKGPVRAYVRDFIDARRNLVGLFMGRPGAYVPLRGCEGYHFMNPENFDQVQVSEDIVGDMKSYLQEGMPVMLSTHNGLAIALELPARVTLEIMETEPVVKGQTASSSYKPAMLSNGVRTLVPGHITPGTRVVIMTEDGSYVERAKD